MLLALLLALANPTDGIAKAINGQMIDTHKFDWAPEQKSDRPIHVRVYPNYQALNATFARLYPGVIDPDVVAFAQMEADTCTIHVLDPKTDYQAAVLGHELTHCLYGHWHNPFRGAPPLVGPDR